jgi:hypothetical protein
MSVGEYEERFRRPASSWHQVLTLAESPIQTRRRRRRCLVATALLAVMRQPAFEVLPGDF